MVYLRFISVIVMMLGFGGCGESTQSLSVRIDEDTSHRTGDLDDAPGMLLDSGGLQGQGAEDVVQDAPGPSQDATMVDGGPETADEPPEAKALCGDGVLGLGEQCDAGLGNGLDGMGCRADCTHPICGDGHRASGEYCDDGNLVSGDGCSATCQTEAALASLVEDPGATYAVVDPGENDVLHESEHFVLRWDDDDGVILSDSAIAATLTHLEEVWTLYIDELGFYAPYTGRDDKYKVNVWVSDQGWATGAGRSDMTTPGEHPGMWVHYNAAQEPAVTAHEFVHTLQYMSGGMRDSRYVGWYWESHAEFMTHQVFPNSVGCSNTLVNAPYLYYGSTRNRYCNWQFSEYLAQTLSLEVINHIWASSLRQPNACYALESPFTALARNLGWSPAQLNDAFGLWAMANVNWDYPEKADIYRQQYGSYDTLGPGQRGRITRLEALDEEARQYITPSFFAPQRWGYNLVRLIPEGGAEDIEVTFRGVVQGEAARETFGEPGFNHEPDSVLPPSSGWRWGVVVVRADGTTRHSPLQAGARASLRVPLEPGDQAVYLVVTGAPHSIQQVFWDQIYYSLYRYPWRVQLKGAYAEGYEPEAFEDPPGISGSRHPNGGGFVADTAIVAQTAYVGPRARVLGEAEVVGYSRIEGAAVIQDEARVQDDAVVAGFALVAGDAEVSGQATVRGAAQLFGGRVFGRALVGATTWIGPGVWVYEDAEVEAITVEWGLPAGARIKGTTKLLGDVECHVGQIEQGVFYGFIDGGVIQDGNQGRDRTEPEVEVTASIDDVSWDTDRADCRFIHQSCQEGLRCVLGEEGYWCSEVGVAATLREPTQVEACLTGLEAEVDPRGNIPIQVPETYICVDAGFVSGVPYDQVQAPVPAENAEAVQWCQAECSTRDSCEGIFYQIHSASYALCGMFNEEIDLDDAEPGKPGEQVCRRVKEP